ncbi:TorF family putative porin [Methylomonas sp. AM2-LC]|uniref:TorF family putative porin n=1 Tax=Methylomonas sp. AM2-LC TaxID=3153301 RepID=UPI003265C22D
MLFLNPKTLFALPFSRLVFLLCYCSSVMAEWHGEVSFRSDYVYHGYSKSRGNPVAQADLNYVSDSGWYAGSGLSQVSFDDHVNPSYSALEVKPYAGVNLPIDDDWHTNLATTGYVYNSKVFSEDADYVDFSASLHYQDWISGKVILAPDAYQRHATVPSYDLNLRHDLADDFQLSAGLGYSQAKALFRQDYFYWNVGASWYLTRYLVVDMRYVDVQLHNYPADGAYPDYFYPRPVENKYLFSVSLGF